MNRKASAALLLLVSSPLLLAHDGLNQTVPYPAPRVSGVQALAFPKSGVELLAWMPLSDLDPSAASGSDCWGYTSPSGREYALICTNTSTAVIEVTDPGVPVLIETVPWVSSLWKDIKTYDEYAYVINEDSEGIQVINLTNVDAGIVTVSTTTNAGACTGASHNVVINEDSGFLYRTGGNNAACPGGTQQGLVIYNLANPASPAFVTRWENLYVHDAQVVTWDVPGPHFGKELAFLCAETSSGGGSPSLQILDVSNKASITTLGSTAYPNNAFSHQGWLSDDKTVFYLNDEADETGFGISTRTRMIDVSNPAAPSFLGFFTTGLAAIDHNLYVNGDRLYEANYRSGLRIFDNSNPTNPVETAFFDTYLEDDAAAFNGLWSNYPYLPSGTIIGSDFDKGFFAWHVGTPSLTFAYPVGLPELIGADGGTVQFSVNEASMGDLQAGTVRFHVDSGSGFTSVLASSLGGSLYEASVPSLPCGSTVDYYVSARTVGGVTWTDPPAAPTQVNSADVGALLSTVDTDNLESNSGWTVGAAGDTATTGIWTRGNPIGTGPQPEDDVSDPGVNCFFTGQGSPGGSVGENDIDGGLTTLVSRSFDATGLSSPVFSYWRWYSNNSNGVADDVMTVDVSRNNGSTWVNVETLGPTGPDSTGGWIRHSFAISDFVVPSANMRLRFRAEDGGSGSIVEAAVDEVQLIDLLCLIEVDSVSPASGPANRDRRVTLTGSGFVAGVSTVSFGGNPGLNVTVLDGSTLEVDVPRPMGPRSGKQGLYYRTVDVTVTTGQGSGTLVNGYTYELPVR